MKLITEINRIDIEIKTKGYNYYWNDKKFYFFQPTFNNLNIRVFNVI